MSTWIVASLSPRCIGQCDLEGREFGCRDSWWQCRLPSQEVETARRFEVMSIPTLILFRDGEPQLRIIGAKGKGQLLQELQSVL